MNLLFINIDNSFCSTKSFMASGKMPLDLSVENRDCFDWISIGLIRKICKNRDIKIIASTHLTHNNTKEDLEKYFGLPFYDLIKAESQIVSETGFSLAVVDEFSKLVAQWIISNQFTKDYLIIDTESKMDFISFVHFIVVDGQEGFLYKNYLQVCEYFSISP